ncbi:integrase [Rodentibacter ratti]|uniref:tyrosine-type recombinase/integrase n=1 Tax=Rodentibacter ratti TaxID=1906745 RepID=UPI00098613CE|nr:site-specific integrase [Rodentibacter ratti]OOF89410.1 integrase [Rodentibacter ratti]
MATIIKRNKGWRAQVRRKGVSKSEQFRTKAEAIAWAKELEEKIINGTYHTGIPYITFADVIDKYIKEVSRYKKSYREERLRLFRLMDMPLGRVYLVDLKEDDFRLWRDERLSKVSVASVLREWNTLSHIMTMACGEWKFLKENPLKNVRKPKTPHARTRRYSHEEIERLKFVSGFSLNRAPLTALSRAGAAMLFALETAMRAGEICNAKWKNYNRQTKILHIPTSKNGHPRNVPLSTKAVAILDTMERLSFGEEEPIFQLTARNLDANFRKLKARAGLDEADLHFHDTRREALTRLAEKVDVMTLAKISGHRDIKILLNTYYSPKMENVVSLLG